MRLLWLGMSRVLCAAAVTLACSSAFAEGIDTAQLDRDLSAGNYTAIFSVLNKVSPNNDNEDVVRWLRSHGNEWYPPLLQALTFHLFHKIQRTPTPELADELMIAYGRTKTSFYIDRGDCLAINRSVQTGNQLIEMMGMLVQGGLQPPTRVLVGSGFAGLEWAAKESARRGNLPPPAIWYCGTDNVAPDAERSAARARRAGELKAQLQALANGVSVPPK